MAKRTSVHQIIEQIFLIRRSKQNRVQQPEPGTEILNRHVDLSRHEGRYSISEVTVRCVSTAQQIGNQV